MIYFTLAQWRGWHELSKSCPRGMPQNIAFCKVQSPVGDLIHPSDLHFFNPFAKKIS